MRKLLTALIFASCALNVSAKSFQDDGTELIYEALCSADGSSTVSRWGNYLDDTEFTFVLKVKQSQVWISEPHNVPIFFSSHHPDRRWNPIVSMISKTAWDAVGNWGVHIQSMDEELFFSRIDVHTGLIFSFAATCTALR